MLLFITKYLISHTRRQQLKCLAYDGFQENAQIAQSCCFKGAHAEEAVLPRCRAKWSLFDQAEKAIRF
jgi:hypothetical protein